VLLMVALQLCHGEKTLERELLCLKHVFCRLSNLTYGLFGCHEVTLCSGSETKALAHRVGFAKAKKAYIVHHSPYIILVRCVSLSVYISGDHMIFTLVF